MRFTILSVAAYIYLLWFFFFNLLYIIHLQSIMSEFIAFSPINYLGFICIYIWIFSSIVLFFVLRGIFKILDFIHSGPFWYAILVYRTIKGIYGIFPT